MEVEITETKTYLEISDGPGTQVEPSETKQIVAPESETVITVEIQEQAGNVVQVTEAPVTVEVIQETVSILEVANWKGDKGDPGEIASTPGSGEYRVVSIRLDASKRIVVVYDETPIP